MFSTYVFFLTTNELKRVYRVWCEKSIRYRTQMITTRLGNHEDARVHQPLRHAQPPLLVAHSTPARNSPAPRPRGQERLDGRSVVEREAEEGASAAPRHHSPRRPSRCQTAAPPFAARRVAPLVAKRVRHHRAAPLHKQRGGADERRAHASCCAAVFCDTTRRSRRCSAPAATERPGTTPPSGPRPRRWARVLPQPPAGGARGATAGGARRPAHGRRLRNRSLDRHLLHRHVRPSSFAAPSRSASRLSGHRIAGAAPVAGTASPAPPLPARRAAPLPSGPPRWCPGSRRGWRAARLPRCPFRRQRPAWLPRARSRGAGTACHRGAA